MTTDPGERRDLKDERESEEYQAMLETVAHEFASRRGYIGRDIHTEAMRRLKAKYKSACGE
jgi:hypothetical protein